MQISIANAIGAARVRGGGTPPEPVETYTIFGVDTTLTDGSSSNADQYQIAFGGSGSIDATIDWGDGTSDVVTSTLDPKLTHTYATGGQYTITVKPVAAGAVANINWGRASGAGEAIKLKSITQFGSGYSQSGITDGFRGCVNLTSLPTAGPTVTFVGDSFFANCDNLASGDLTGWLAVAGGMQNFASDASGFNVNVNSWNVSGVTNFGSVFASASSFNQPLDGWDISSATEMDYMFYLATSFNQDIGGWDTSSALNMRFVFLGATSYNNNGVGGIGAGIDQWDVSSVFRMNLLFNNATSFNQYIGSWNTISCREFSGFFKGATSFNNDGIGGVGVGMDNWNLSSATKTDSMFYNASSFNQYIGSWDVSSVTDMSEMFRNPARTESFNNGDASGVAGGGVGIGMDNWDTSSVTDMSDMFSNAGAFNQYIGSWDVSNVTTFSNMFYNTGNNGFDRDISNWDVSGCTNFSGMFWQNNPFTNDGVNGAGVGLDTWTIATTLGGVNMARMFSGTGQNWYLASWDTSLVTLMQSMFQNCINFNPDYLGNWSIQNLISASNMLSNTAITTSNYDALLIGWAAQAPNIQSGVTLSDVPCQYSSAAAAAHDLLTGTYFWSITDQGQAVAQTLFTVDTKNTATGSSAADQYAITFGTGGAIDATIYWGDGTNNKITSTSDPNLTHTYATQGIYQIAIEATDPAVTRTTNLVFGSLTNLVAGDCLKITSIDSWGDCTYDSSVDDYWMAYTQFLTSVPVTGPTNFVLKRGTFFGSAIPNPRLDGYSSVTVSSGTWLFRNSSISGGLNGSLVMPSQNLLGAFQGASSFNEDLNNWDVSLANGITSCFLGATSFNGNIENWDTSSMTAMNNAFGGASAFNRDLSNWNVSSVTSFIQTFNNATGFNNGGVGGVGAGLDNWSINSNLAVNVSMYQMFFGATAFNQYIGSWSMSRVGNVTLMFSGATSFNNGDAAGVSGGGSGVGMDRWDLGQVTNYSSMFKGASAFNQHIGGWNTRYVTTMDNMFNDATSFDQPLGSWNIESLTDATDMFTNSGLSTANYDDLLIGWAANPIIKPNVTLSVIPVNFTPGGAAELAYNLLTGTGGWTIIDPNHP